MHPLIVLVGESGGGKSALLDVMLWRFPDKLRVLTSITTRSRRGPEDDTFYEFVTHEEFKRREREGQILQSTSGFGNRYGTDRLRTNEILSGHVGITIMFEESIHKMRAAGYTVNAVRIIPEGHPRREGRAAEDQSRTRVFSTDVERVIHNKFPDGFNEAVETLAAFIADSKNF